MLKNGDKDAYHYYDSSAENVMKDCIAFSNTSGGYIHLLNPVAIEPVLEKFFGDCDTYISDKNFKKCCFVAKADEEEIKILIPATAGKKVFFTPEGEQKGKYYRFQEKSLSLSFDALGRLDETTQARIINQQGLDEVLLSDQCPSLLRIEDMRDKRSSVDLCGAIFMQYQKALDHLGSIIGYGNGHYLMPSAQAAVETVFLYRDYYNFTKARIELRQNSIEIFIPAQLKAPFTINDLIRGGLYPYNINISVLLSNIGLQVSDCELMYLSEYYEEYGLEIKGRTTDHVIRISIPSINKSPLWAETPKISDRAQNVLKILSRDYCLSRPAIQRELDIPPASLIRLLNDLVEKGLVEKIGVARNTLYRIKLQMPK